MITLSGHTFDGDYLGSQASVVDLGGNRGAFARAVTQRFACRCYVVEASPDLCAGLASDRIEVFNYAVSDRPHEATFYVCPNSEASGLSRPRGEILGTRLVPALDLPSLTVLMGVARIDLLKVDIEGAEIPMFRGLSDDFIAGIAQMTVEFHDFAGVPLAHVRAIVSRIVTLGFHAIRFSRTDHSDVWFVNRTLCEPSRARLAYLRHVYRNVAGLRRVLARRFPRGTLGGPGDR